jgi:hypothetical protein
VKAEPITQTAFVVEKDSACSLSWNSYYAMAVIELGEAVARSVGKAP